MGLRAQELPLEKFRRTPNPSLARPAGNSPLGAGCEARQGEVNGTPGARFAGNQRNRLGEGFVCTCHCQLPRTKRSCESRESPSRYWPCRVGWCRVGWVPLTQGSRYFGDRSHTTLSTSGEDTPPRAPHRLLHLLSPASPGSPISSASPAPGPAGSSPAQPGMRGRAEGPRPLWGRRGGEGVAAGQISG